MLDPIDYWRFHEELTIIQAVLLIIGEDPSSQQEYVLDNHAELRPLGFNAVFFAITSAINNKKLDATVRYGARQAGLGEKPREDEKMQVLAKFRVMSNAFVDDEITSADIIIKVSPDWSLTTVDVDNLKRWLLSRNFKPDFFFSETACAPDYLDKTHPRYSAKLAASVKVWLAMEDGNFLTGKATKTALTSWLENHYQELGLVYDGNINKTGIEECTKVANWNDKGGATKTPVCQSTAKSFHLSTPKSFQVGE